MLVISGLTTLVLLAVAFLLPVPFVKLAPGPTFNVIGEDGGEPVIRITGVQTYPTTGSLDMTTVGFGMAVVATVFLGRKMPVHSPTS